MKTCKKEKTYKVQLGTVTKEKATVRMQYNSSTTKPLISVLTMFSNVPTAFSEQLSMRKGRCCLCLWNVQMCPEFTEQLEVSSTCHIKIDWDESAYRKKWLIFIRCKLTGPEVFELYSKGLKW